MGHEQICKQVGGEGRTIREGVCVITVDCFTSATALQMRQQCPAVKKKQKIGLTTSGFWFFKCSDTRLQILSFESKTGDGAGR